MHLRLISFNSLKIKSLILILLLSFQALLFSQAPNYSWAANNSSTGREIAYSLAVDSVNKFIYSSGYIEQSAAFPGLNAADMNFGTGNGNKDGYIAKHDFNGNLIWVVNLGSVGDDEVRSIALGIDGNIYATGICQQTGVWFKSIGSPNYTLTPNSNNVDVFVASYTSNGRIRWVRRGGGIANDFAHSITTTKNSVVVMGTYKNAASFGPYNTTNLYNTVHNHFIVSYNFSGNELWLTEAKSDSDDGMNSTFIYQHSKIISANDTIYLIGEMGGNNMTFINSNGTPFGTILTNSGAISNIFYSALSVTGNWIWTQQVDASVENPQLGFGITADCAGLYISGAVHPAATFPSGYSLNSVVHDVPFMARCSHANGIDSWVRYWTPSSKVNHEDIAQCVFADNKGYIYVAGNYRSTNFFAPVGDLGIANGTEMFLAKYQNDGTFLWVQSLVGSNNNYIHDLKCTDSKVVMCGHYISDITIPGLSQIIGPSDENIYLTLGNLNLNPQFCNCCLNPPTIALTSPDQSICAVNLTTINANSPIVGLGAWYKVEGGNSNGSGILSNSIIPSNTLTGLTPGNNIFNWVISNGFCNPTMDSISVSIYAMPSLANAGANQTICATFTNMAANTPTAGIGTWTVLSGNASIVSPNSPTTSITSIGVGTNVLQWTIANGVCPSSSSTLEILRDDFPSLSIAGPDQTICVTTATMAANIPTVGIGTWSLISGLASIVSPNSPSTELTSVGLGTNVLEWVISNGVCNPPSASTVTVIREAPPSIAAAGIDQTICAVSFSLSGNTPTVGVGTWSLLSGGGFIVSPNSPTSAVTSLSVGTNVFEWTIANSCSSSSSTVAVTRDDFPTVALAGSDQTICVGTSSVSANIPLVGTGMWSLVLGTLSINTPSQFTTALTSIAVGTNIVQWSITNGVCPPSVSNVIVQRDGLPSLSIAGPSMQICSTSTIMTGNTPTVGIGTWSVLSGSATIVSPNSPTTQLTAIAVGTNILQWSISNGVCSPPNVSTVMIVRDDFPILANAGSDQTICSTTAILAGNTPTLGTGLWTLLAGSANIVSPSSPNSLLTAVGVGTNIFQWSITFGSCSPSTSTVQIIRDDFPTMANAGPDQLICSPTSVMSGNTPTVGIGTWSVLSGSANFGTPNSPISNVNSISVGTNVLQWSIVNGSCPPSTSTMIIARDDYPTNAFAGADQIICSSTATMTGNTPTLGIGTWSVLSGSANIVAPNSPITELTAIGIGTNILQWDISYGVCPPSTSTMMVLHYDLPSVSMAGISQTVCSFSVALAGNSPTVGTGTWSLISGGGVIVSPNSHSSAVVSLSTGINIFEWTITNGVCPPSSSTVSVEKEDSPSLAIAGTLSPVCSSSILLSGNTPTQGVGSWSVISGSALISNSLLPNALLTSIGVGTNILQWSISFGTCPPNTSTVMVIRDDLPTSAVAGNDQILCGKAYSFSANVPFVGTASWLPIGSAPAPSSLFSSQSTVSFMNEGVFKYVWKIQNGVCLPSADTVQLTVYFVPSMPNAGQDQVICGTSTSLAANQISVGTSLWISLDPGATVNSPTYNLSSVTFTSQGDWKFVWKAMNGICPVLSDTVLIKNFLLPSAANAGNDIVSDNSTTKLNAEVPLIGIGKWSTTSNDCEITNSFDPKSLFSANGEGIYHLLWTVSNGTCPESTDELTVEIRTSVIPEIITPNGDGSNDFLEFKNLKREKDVKLIIFNRWGNIVFKSEDYRSEFNGIGKDGEKLPDDAYFYILEYSGNKISKNLIIKTSQ